MLWQWNMTWNGTLDGSSVVQARRGVLCRPWQLLFPLYQNLELALPLMPAADWTRKTFCIFQVLRICCNRPLFGVSLLKVSDDIHPGNRWNASWRVLKSWKKLGVHIWYRMLDAGTLYETPVSQIIWKVFLGHIPIRILHSLRQGTHSKVYATLEESGSFRANLLAA